MDAVAAVLASAVLLVVALAVHLHLPLAVAGKSNIIHLTMKTLTSHAVTVEATVAAVAEATLPIDELALLSVEATTGRQFS